MCCDIGEHFTTMRLVVAADAWKEQPQHFTQEQQLAVPEQIRFQGTERFIEDPCSL